MPRKLVLVGPDGRARREVVPGTPLEAQLREAGWVEPGAAAPPRPSPAAAGGGSETARLAREALATLSPEDWVRDWGYVLCASLDEVEGSHAVVSARATAALDAVLAGMEAVKAVTEACSSWMLRTGWTAGKSALEPTRERQAAAEDLNRLLLDVSATFRRRTAAFLFDSGALDSLDSRAGAVRGDPTARARASSILDELSREFPPNLPGGEHIQEAIRRVRADFLGGSNVPPPGDDGEPSLTGWATRRSPSSSGRAR